MSEGRWRFGGLVAGFDPGAPRARAYLEHVYGACRVDEPADLRFVLEARGGQSSLRPERPEHALPVETERSLRRFFGAEGEEVPPSWPVESAVAMTLRAWAEGVLLHAAAVEVHGRALLLVAPSGGGKTTLALALARRGHGLLSDELVPVRWEGAQILPFPRTLFVRSEADPEGPRAVVRPEGLRRATPGPLCGALFLGPREERAALRPLRLTLGDPGLLQPLTQSFLVAASWGPEPGAWLLRHARVQGLLARVPGQRLALGGIEETADLIEGFAARC